MGYTYHDLSIRIYIYSVMRVRVGTIRMAFTKSFPVGYFFFFFFYYFLVSHGVIGEGLF